MNFKAKGNTATVSLSECWTLPEFDHTEGENMKASQLRAQMAFLFLVYISTLPSSETE